MAPDSLVVHIRDEIYGRFQEIELEDMKLAGAVGEAVFSPPTLASLDKARSAPD